MFAHGTTVLCNMLMVHDTVADKCLEIVILRGVFNFLSNDIVVQHCVLGRHCHANVSRLARQCCTFGCDSVMPIAGADFCNPRPPTSHPAYPMLIGSDPPEAEKIAEPNLTLSKPDT